MTFDRAMLDYLANLSALELSEDEVPSLLNDIETILSFVKRVQDVDLPTIDDLPGTSTHRNDVVVDSSSPALFDCAPDLKENLFCTPVVTDSLSSSKGTLKESS